MADETLGGSTIDIDALEKGFKDVLESLGKIVHRELQIIDLFKNLLTDQDPEIWAEREKEGLLENMRTILDELVTGIAKDRQDEWQSVRRAFFPEEVRLVTGSEEKDPDTTPGGESRSEELFERCPPGFVEVGGICMPI